MAMKAAEMQKLIPRALRRARQRAGLSVEVLAGKAQISSQAVQKHEDGVNLPQVDVFVRELDALGLDFGAFHEVLIEERTNSELDPVRAELRELNSRLRRLETNAKPKAA